MGSSQLEEYAVKTSTGFKCEFCGEEYAGNIARFRWHLAKIEGHDVNICPSVSEDVQKAASAAASEEISSRKRVSSWTDENPNTKRGFILNPTDVSGAATQIPNSPVKSSDLVKTIGVPLCTAEIAEIVGVQLIRRLKDIWSFFMDDNVSTFGICGAAGVGKTEVAKFLNNTLLKRSNKFHQVIYVDASFDWRLTLSPDCKVQKVQSVISEAIGLDLLDGPNEKRRIQLSNELIGKKKCLLILDGVWGYFSLKEVGIPQGANQCTVGITTRSLEVCREFDCKEIIELQPLPAEKSFELYKKILGKDTKLSEEGERISKLIVGKCGGLPLAVITMARNMRGITDAGQLRDAVDGLMRKKVVAKMLPRLKLSYDYLENPTLQQCFLYCALFVGEPYKTLMEFLVDEGIIERMTSRQKELDLSNTMVRILQDVCLLEIDDDVVKMNEMMQSMALQIMEENQQRAMIIYGMSLRVLPHVESWTEDLVRVSFTNSDEIETIPLNYSPSCSKLSTLLLSNLSLRYIGDSFFEGFPGLKILCLSETMIESVPISVCGLVNLTTLLLSQCKKLRKIPSVAKLRALKKLDLSFSGVEEVPDGIDMLSELKYLDLIGTQVKELKSGILAKFSHLQVLRLPWSIAVKAEEIAFLRWLEVLSCTFTDVAELNKYLMPLKGFKEREPPLNLRVQAGVGIQCPFYTFFGYSPSFDDPPRNVDAMVYLSEMEGSRIGLHQCNVNKLVDVLNDFEMIVIVNCNESRSFCNFSPIKNAAEFSSLSVRECDGLEFLFSLSLSAEGILEKLENIALVNLKSFSSLFSKGVSLSASLPPHYGTCFSHLVRFFIRDCPSIKQLFPLDLLPNLKNLELIDVRNCALLEEIFAIKEEEGNSNSFSLPKLDWFNLGGVPKLKSICNVPIICDALKNIDLKGCPKLETDVVQVYCTTPQGTYEMVSFRQW